MTIFFAIRAQAGEGWKEPRKDREPATSLPMWPDRPAHLSIQIPVPVRSFVEHAAQARESPVFATLLNSALVATDAK